MLPILNKPIIQYAVEECHESGIGDVIIVTGHGKEALEVHFRQAPELESHLERAGKHDVAEQIRRISRLARFYYVIQPQSLGLGHAVLCAKALVGAEPFAVLLSDVFIDGPRPATRQLIEVYETQGASVVAVEPVPGERVGRCGIVAVEPGPPDSRLFRVLDVVEKPDPSQAPSNLGIMGRYIFDPEIFDCLERTPAGKGGEIQLTDALSLLARQGELWAFVCDGKSFDAGERAGLLQLTIQMALRDPELASWLQPYLRSLA